jgi:hypothetical protein
VEKYACAWKKSHDQDFDGLKTVSIDVRALQMKCNVQNENLARLCAASGQG